MHAWRMDGWMDDELLREDVEGNFLFPAKDVVIIAGGLVNVFFKVFDEADEVSFVIFILVTKDGVVDVVEDVSPRFLDVLEEASEGAFVEMDFVVEEPDVVGLAIESEGEGGTQDVFGFTLGAGFGRRYE